MALLACPPPSTAPCRVDTECPHLYSCVQGQCRLVAALDASAGDGAVGVDAATAADAASQVEAGSSVDTGPVADAILPVDAVVTDLDGALEAGPDVGTADGTTGGGEVGTSDASSGTDSTQGQQDGGQAGSEAGTEADASGPDDGGLSLDAGVLPVDGGSGAADGTVTPPDAGLPPGCGTVQALRDDFTVAHDDVLWWDWADPGATLSEQGGTLQLDFTEAQVDAYAGKESAYLVRLTGGTMRVEVRDGLVDTAAGNSAWLRFSLSQENRVGFHIEGDTLWAQLVVDGQDLDHAMATYDPSAHRWWQLRERDGQVYFEVSADGLFFGELHRVPTPPFAERGRVQIGGGHYDQLAAPDRIEYADFNANLVDPGWCPAHSYGDGFDGAELGGDWSADRSVDCSVAVSGSALHLTAANQELRCQASVRRPLSMENSSVALHLVEVPLEAGVTTRLTLHAPGGGLWWEWGRRADKLVAYGESPGNPSFTQNVEAGTYRWLRIRRADANLFFDARGDQAGPDWTTLASTSVASDFSAMVLAVELYIDGDIALGSATYQAVVDSLNLED